MTAYSHREVARIFRISPARLRYWERTDLVRPGAERDARPAFGFRDLVRIRRVLDLLGRGVPLCRIRRSVRDLAARLPEVDDPLPALRLWGAARVVAELAEGGLLQPDGQLVLDFRPLPDPQRAVASLAAPREELDAAGWFERGCLLDTEPATWGEAVEAYRRAIALEPRHADAHCNLGTVLYHQGRRAAAGESFRRALEIEPLHLEANFNLANLLEEEGAAEAALRHYRAVLRSDPLYADAHVNLALLSERLGARGRARDHWRRYLQIEPGGAWADAARRHLTPGPKRPPA